MFWEKKGVSLHPAVFGALSCVLAQPVPSWLFAGVVGRLAAHSYYLKSISVHGRMEETKETDCKGNYDTSEAPSAFWSTEEVKRG